MEIPGSASLKEATLKLSTENGQHVYLLVEPVSGRILKLRAAVARIFWKVSNSFSDSDVKLDTDEVERAAALSGYLQQSRINAINAKAKRNPLFINLPLFNAGSFQPFLKVPARIIFSRFGFATFLCLLITSIWTATISDFALSTRLSDIFSLEAILTFAVIAPFLKILHELGHVLAATRFGVNVRKCGVIIIALYPLPFVDCSEAEYSATRSQRIIISLAGMWTDIAIGLAAFLLWHFSTDPWTQQLLSNIFIFNTVTTLLFNLNPLMKLDGYFAITDALHRRNWHQESALAFRRLKNAVLDFKGREIIKEIRIEAAKHSYALLSTGYKFYILAIISWSLLPQFWGLGLVLVAWGTFALFLYPYFTTERLEAEKPKMSYKRKIIWPALLAITILGLAFVPMRSSMTVPIAVDFGDAYQLKAGIQGTIVQISKVGQFSKGEQLAKLENIELAQSVEFTHMQRKLYTQFSESVRGQGPLAIEAARIRLQANEDEMKRQLENQTSLNVVAKYDGWFRPLDNLKQGSFLNQGDALGVYLPVTSTTSLSGKFQEIYRSKIEKQLETIEIWHGYGDEPLKLPSAKHVLQINRASNEGELSTSYAVKLSVERAPSELAGKALFIKTIFEPEPIWKHGEFLYTRLKFNFLQARELARPD